MMNSTKRLIVASVIGFGLTIAALPSFAGEHRDKGRHEESDERVPPVTDPLTLKECGSCHIAFPPSLMPAASWKAVMDDLSNHFGEDASLPADKTAAITAYLTSVAGRDGLIAGKPPLRISEQGWWIREHRKEISPARWTEVGSKANCKACHRDAEKGYFED